MHKPHLPWLIAMFTLAQAVRLPPVTEDGLWVMTRQGDGTRNYNDPVRLDFTFRPHPQSNDLNHETSVRASWPWRPASSSASFSQNEATRLLESSSTSKTSRSVRRLNSIAETSASSYKDSACGKNHINTNDSTYAEEQMAYYCDRAGVVDAYAHLASKWGSAIVYICARGHAETCSAHDLAMSMDYIDHECHEESGWVYNNYLDAQGPANKYGVDIVGADIC